MRSLPLALLLLAPTLAAQEARDPRAVLAEALAAIEKVPGARYVADLELRVGPDAPPKIAKGATVELGAPLGEARGPFQRLFRVEGAWAPTEPEAAPQPFAVAFDGAHARYPLHARKLFVEEDVGGRGFAMLEAYMLLLPGWSDPGPLRPPAEVSVALGGSADIAGIECDELVLRRSVAAPVPDAPARVLEERLWLGREDRLPRRYRMQVRAAGDEGGPAEFGFDARVSALELGVELPRERFVLARPEGYRLEQMGGEREERGRLAVGDPAPDFELADGEGRTHTLASMRGKVVVLDFWATWCGPCKLAMPGLQKLHERFAGRPVKVVGLSTRERGGDPTAFMREKGYTYLGLVKAEAAARAYGVSGIPHLFVIDAEGKLAFQQVGYRPDLEEELARVIERLLEGV